MLIIGVSRHPSHIHHQVSTRIIISIVFFKFRYFELPRYFHIWNQTRIIHILPKHLFSSEGLQFFLHLIKLILKIIHSIIVTQAFTWWRNKAINIIISKWYNIHRKRCDIVNLISSNRSNALQVVQEQQQPEKMEQPEHLDYSLLA